MLCVPGRQARTSLQEDPRASEDGAAPAAGDTHIHHTSMGDPPGARRGTRTGETPGTSQMWSLLSQSLQSSKKTKQEQGIQSSVKVCWLGSVQTFGILYTLH